MPEPAYRHPEAIVSGEWLEAHLGDPGLRIFDCTTYLRYEEGTGRPYRVESGRADYEADHVPGAAFLDLQGDFSIEDSLYRFTLPSPDVLAQAFAAHGIGDGVRAVLYARGNMQWATRFWWMLRSIGFDDTAVLDGGMDKWLADGRAVEAGSNDYPATTMTARPREGLFTDKAGTLAAIGAEGVCTINALGADLHSGANARYGRPGRVPGSVNVPALSLLDPETKALADAATAAEAFAAVGATPDKRIVAYCGGGIAATLDAFLLHQLGYEKVAVYDASMSEWATDESLPIEVG